MNLIFLVFIFLIPFLCDSLDTKFLGILVLRWHWIHSLFLWSIYKIFFISIFCYTCLGQSLYPVFRHLRKEMWSTCFFKGLNQIFGMIEYLYKAQKYPFWPTDTKQYFWKSETSIETSQKLSSRIKVTCKLDLECVKNLNQILWVIEYWCNLRKWQI